MKRDGWNSEAIDEEGRPEIETTYFPPRIFREPPNWLKGQLFVQTCPDEVEKLMKELYIALQNDCNAAATMLMRAIFEHTMIDKVEDQRSFAKNIGKFEEQVFIGRKHAEVVSSMLEAGHASIHRAFIPKKDDIITLVDILESILKVVYVVGMLQGFIVNALAWERITVQAIHQAVGILYLILLQSSGRIEDMHAVL